jgi:PIN like domain
VSHPEGLPNLFVDRSLGRIQVPTLLRNEGLRLVTLAERYGVPADETIGDVQWLTDAGRFGEAVLMKDERIRYNEAEKHAVKQFSVMCFCLSKKNLKSTEMAAYFIKNLAAITRACASGGPVIAVVHSDHIRQIPLDDL